MTIKELDVVRITVPFEGKDDEDESLIHHLPAGFEGTVIGALDNACHIEFIIEKPDDDLSYCFLSIEHQFLERV